MTNTDEFAGYHPFQNEEGAEYGSFEVFYHNPHQGVEESSPTKEGWYWWSCFPGCLPDGEPNGPFPTSEGAYLDALSD